MISVPSASWKSNGEAEAVTKAVPQGYSGLFAPQAQCSRQHLPDRLSRLHRKWIRAHSYPEKEHDDEQGQAPS